MFNVSQACLPSLLCATSRSFQNFYFTDRYGSVLKQAKLNVAENMRKHMDHPEELECRFMKLEWGKKLPSIVKVVDLVLGADVVYFPESHDLLITTLKALFFIAKANVVLLCHPERCVSICFELKTFQGVNRILDFAGSLNRIPTCNTFSWMITIQNYRNPAKSLCILCLSKRGNNIFNFLIESSFHFWSWFR